MDIRSDTHQFISGHCLKNAHQELIIQFSLITRLVFKWHCFHKLFLTDIRIYKPIIFCLFLKILINKFIKIIGFFGCFEIISLCAIDNFIRAFAHTSNKIICFSIGTCNDIRSSFQFTSLIVINFQWTTRNRRIDSG